MGVDVETYEQGHLRIPRSLLFVGRISQAKNLDVVFSSLPHLKHSSKMDIFGTPGPGNAEYAESLRGSDRELEKKALISYNVGVPHSEPPSVYGPHDVFVHVGSLRDFNKTLFEAMAAGNIVVTSDPSMKGVVGNKFFVEDVTES